MERTGDIRKAEDLKICFVGNMLGKNPDYITTQGQIVSESLSAEGLEIIPVSSKINKVLRLLDIVATLLRGAGSFDVVVMEVYSGQNFIAATFVAFICRLFRLPLLMVLHGGNLPEFAAKHPRWSRSVLSKADRLAAPSGFLADGIGRLGFEVEVVPNAIEIDNYNYRKRSPARAKLLWMRSFHPIYDPLMAVSVLDELTERGRDASLVMAGKDKGLEKKAKERARELGLSGKIRFAGFLDAESKDREFGSADIFINTNRIDNMPVAIVEARAYGLPVVSTDVGGIPYVIVDGVDGFLVPEGDAAAMADRIESLLDDEVLAASVSEKGRLKAEECSWVTLGPRWKTLIEETAAGRSAGGSDKADQGDAAAAVRRARTGI